MLANRLDTMKTACPGKSQSDSAESQFATDVEMRRNKRATHVKLIVMCEDKALFSVVSPTSTCAIYDY